MYIYKFLAVIPDERLLIESDADTQVYICMYLFICIYIYNCVCVHIYACVYIYMCACTIAWQ